MMADSPSRVQTPNWSVCLQEAKYQFAVYTVGMIEIVLQGGKI